MDLDEYLFYEKKKDENFCHRDFAEQVGISPGNFSKILKRKIYPSSSFLYRLHTYTEGKVDIVKMLVDAYGKKKINKAENKQRRKE